MLKNRLYSLGVRVRLTQKRQSDYWKRERINYSIRQFRNCLERVPAYRKFLLEHKIDPADIRTYKNFEDLVPPMNKDEYLRKFSLEDLCEDGTLSRQSLVLTSTSGSTGNPFYFPRNGILDYQSSLYHEMFLRWAEIDSKKSTLVIVGFGMGVWIGGVITYEAFKTISERGHNLSIITPGVNKKEIFEAMRNLAPHYDQIILCGYPPFMKDVVDEGVSEGINWKKHDIRLICAAEAFSEKFRDHIMSRLGIKNPYRHVMNIYGSADLGTMATETPVSILVRRLALRKPKLYKAIFREANRLPTLAQFHPHFVNFEAKNGRIFVTGENIIPLVRYEIGDNGGVLDYADVEAACTAAGLDLPHEIRRAGIANTVMELPFVYIYERTDLSTKLYGAIIYPEHVKAGLESHPLLARHITGKFTMFTKHDKKHNEYLEINIEMKPNVRETRELGKMVVEAVVKGLVEKSAEYAYLTGALHERIHPRVVFWPHGHPNHFQVGIKQKWVKVK